VDDVSEERHNLLGIKVSDRACLDPL
jgi:hypothetical protein